MNNMGRSQNIDREMVIIRTSITGIAANIVLVIFKAVVGLASNSIAVILDAVNNLSDALSSIITIIGTKLSGKRPDKKHPYGYGRIEYMSQTIVAAIILYAGMTSLSESVKKIITPEQLDYSFVSVIIIAAAVVVKLILGFYVRKKGNEVNSGSLEASGTDALSDAVLSGSVLVCAIVYMLSGVSLEAYVGAVISLFIIKSGFEMIKDAVDEMLGMRVQSELSKGIRHTIASQEGVHGVYDLILHNYGPDRYLASAHIEVNDTMRADEIDALTRKIQKEVYTEYSVIMTAVGVYSVNTSGDEIAEIRDSVRNKVMSFDGVLQMHGFYIDMEKKTMQFDVVIDFGSARETIYAEICGEIQKAYPDYSLIIALDNDISD